MNTKHQGLFIRIPKTASSSITKWIEPYPQILQNKRDNIIGRLSPAWLEEGLLKLFADVIGEEVLAEYFTFAIVRNPFDRAISSWKHVNRHRKVIKLTFRKFLYRLRDHRLKLNELWHCTGQLQHVTNKKKEIEVSFIGRFEQLDRDVKRIASELGIAEPHLKLILASRRKEYQHYYNDETRRLVTRLYKEDLDAFEYRF